MMFDRPIPARAALVALLVALLAALAPAGPPARADDPVALTDLGWVWPLDRMRIVAPFVAPAHEYGPGHRGIDIRPLDEGEVTLRSPADGIIAFAGRVADRSVVTIDHGGGLVTTLEPAEAIAAVGSEVRRGDPVATGSIGGHAAPGAVHFGVRSDGRYINPMLLLGGVPRAVLLPCCEDLQS